MRADLIERLRKLVVKIDPFSLGDTDARLVREAADALASQEPIGYVHPEDITEMKEFGRCYIWKSPVKNGYPLFTSPVVPVAAKGEAEGWRPTHRHLKSGHLVRVLGIGRMQAANWYSDRAHRPADMREVVIYEHGGGLWARPRDEFEDGRFEPLPAAPTREGEGQ